MDLYKIIFNPEEENSGVYGISLVEDPAIGVNFVALSKHKEVKLTLANDEKRLLVGPVLIPEKKIYRDFKGGCEIYFDADTIRMASQEFFKNGYQSNSTIDHESDFIKNVTFVESWIVDDKQHDKSRAYGFDVPVGTWMVSMKVESDEIWNDFVKEGKVKGFSIDSFFKFEKVSLNKIKNNNTDKKMGNNIRKYLSETAKFLGMANDELAKVDMLEIEVPEIGKLQAEDFSLDYIVSKDVDGTWEPLVDYKFVYEGKEFTTDATGKITDIVDVVEDKEPIVTDAPVVELSEDVQLWKYDGEDGKGYFTTWLGFGEIVTDEAKALVASTSFTVAGIKYTTDEMGAIVGQEKDAASPYWRKEEDGEVAPATDVVEDVAPTEDVTMSARLARIEKALNLETVEEVKEVVEDRADELEDVVEEAKAALTLEEAMAKIDELQALINTMKGEVSKVTEEVVELRKLPAATKLKATPQINKGITGNSKEERRAALWASIK